MRRFAPVGVLVCAVALPVTAQVNHSGQLVVTMTVQSSISLVFNNSTNVGTTGFCPLSNAGTSDVGLDLGAASAVTGDTLPCVLYTQPAADYVVSSGFDVVVTKANTASASYQLAAKISATPPANVTWMVNNIAMTTAFTTLSTANTYSSRIANTVGVRVKKTVPAQTLTETITFLATAN
jgi:hypothetical protein